MSGASPDASAAACLRQASAELDASRGEVGESVRAMLLHMVFEKIAKAALLKSGQWTVEQAQTSHLGASHMMQMLTHIRRVRAHLSLTQGQLRALKPLVDELEGLQPANARHRGQTSGPWLEYPWETPAGLVVTPGEALPNLRRYGVHGAPAVRQLTALAIELIQKHDALFG